MKLLAITLVGCCFTALLTSLALYEDFIPSPINSEASDARVIQATTPLPSVRKSVVSQITPLPFSEQSKRSIVFTLPVTYIIGERHIYENGLTVTLQAIRDTRCAANETCATPGQLEIEFTVLRATTTETVILGSGRSTTVITPMYEYTLVNSIETQATIIITPKSTGAERSSTITPNNFIKTAPRAISAVASAQEQNTLITSTTTIQTPGVPANTDTSITNFNKALVTEIERQTNIFRINNKRAPLSFDTNLTKNATQYSTHLLTNKYLSHTDLHGCDITCRFAHKGYSATAWGENLALLSFEEQPSVEYVANFFMTQWQKSAGHRENLLSKTFTNQGIGIAVDRTNIYVVVQFARPL